MAEVEILGYVFTQEQLEAYATLVAILGGAAATGLLLGVMLDLLVPRRRKEGGGDGERPGVEKREKSVEEPRIPGVETAVAVHVARMVKSMLESGEVKIKLVRDDCEGEIVFDLNTNEFRCIDEEGRLRGLGEPEAEDSLEELVRGGGGRRGRRG
ncbi:unnamed protein product [Aeropyrum globular virus 1]|uniref:hypothetical protein n=1 Tax=Aeropyrum globular virus 1 TaxID=1932713 RepID=UPI000C7F5971|nr:hypothetical protein C1186_gp06 [Aeropyrum globular virus 1]BBC20932.1 unnamed protein product [Aeropyrum globular virus 1]